ncbi:phosphotransferase family protein [Aneurinibacillus terranovensis]|uniref:phosphotransferase family protein n=1 Tax=Aneurinibacillus terranovensis TaxID=278991 RepID=UPI0003FE9847|nr:phosphotransferase family protein [Aneurinibacillus terranovensis]
MEQNEVNAVHTIQKINWERIEHFLRSHIEQLGSEPMEVKQFSAGYSNLTFLIRIGEWVAVLRRPPFGPIPPKAHDMEREYRILWKINPVFPLAPKPYLFCNDLSIMERPFYVMERKQGTVIDDQLPPEYEDTEETAKMISETVVKTLVQLHEIDIKTAGLSDLGHPEGYLERQVHGWIKRYHHSKTDEIHVVEEIEKWLVRNMPVSPYPTIVHNDFKLNNMMLSKNDPGKAVAVFDWEMCTIGDPLTDLGSSLAYWTEEGEAFTGLTSVTNNPGFIKRREFIDLYAKKSGRDLTHIDFYLTFAFYKIGVILQQIYYRWKQGEASDERFGKLGEGVCNLMQQSYRALQKELL